jgi:hypothetical protein
MMSGSAASRDLTGASVYYRPDVAQFQNIFPLISYGAFKICASHSVPIVLRISNYRFLCPKSTLYRDGKYAKTAWGNGSHTRTSMHSCYTTNPARVRCAFHQSLSDEAETYARESERLSFPDPLCP